MCCNATLTHIHSGSQPEKPTSPSTSLTGITYYAMRGNNYFEMKVLNI